VSSKAFCSLALAVVASVAAIPRLALAAPRLSVSVEGDCPRADQLEAALLARGLELGDSEYRVSVATSADQVLLRLSRHGGDSVLTRHFSSRDCAAVAEAAAVVVEAYFIEVYSNASGEGLGRSRATQQSQAAAPVGDPVPEVADPSGRGRQGRNAQLAPLSPHAGQVAPVSGLVSGPFLAHAPFRVRPVPIARPNGFFAVGPVVSLPGGGVTAQVEGGGGLEWGGLPLSTQLGLATSVPSVAGRQPNRTRRWATQGVLRIGVPFGGQVRYRPWVGLGGMVAQLRALDVASSTTKVSTSVLVGAGLELAWPVRHNWSGRLDLGCLMLTSRDSYRVEPDGEIGRGPRVVCAALVGMQFGSGYAIAER